MEEKNLMQEFCVYFYDFYIMPRFEEEWKNRMECAEALESFLKQMGMTFDEFYHYVLDYSLGNGIQYMREVNEMIPLLYPISAGMSKEMKNQILGNCTPGAAVLRDTYSPAPNSIPPIGEDNGHIH